MVSMAVLIRTTFEWNCQMVVVPEFGAELPLDNCTPTFILNNPVFYFHYFHYLAVQ